MILPDQVLAGSQVIQGRLRQQAAARQAEALQAAGRAQLCHPRVGHPRARRQVQVCQGGQGLGHVSKQQESLVTNGAGSFYSQTSA